MRVFTVHVPPPRRAAQIRFLREGFSWWGLLLGPLWLLLRGAWPFALIGAIALALLPWVVWPGIFLLSGLCGQDMRRVTIGLRGWQLNGVVVGADSEQAELRWFDRQSVSPSDRLG